MKKILITNDDGINSDGLIRLAACAIKFGEVWVVAPDGQRSAFSHSVTLHSPIDVWHVDFPVPGVHAWAITGTPSDCVRLGVPNLVKAVPDAVFSGINFGYNIGTDIQYSATVGAALEAASQGIPAIAFSEGTGKSHVITEDFLEKMIAEYLEKPLEDNQIWNINFPDCQREEFRGILTGRTVARNAVFLDHYMEEKLADGRIRMQVVGKMQRNGAPGTDFEAVCSNCISVGIVNNLKAPGTMGHHKKQG